MLYIIGIAIIIFLAIIYKNLNKCSDVDEDMVDDIPTLNLGKEELKNYAREISIIPAEVKKRGCKKKLIDSLDKNYKNILDGYNFFNGEIKNRTEVVSCAEWLLDNLYLIKKEYKDIKSNMPGNYYRELPVITKGSMKGYPRIYYIAREMLLCTYGTVSEEAIETFISAYEENTVLKSCELWALPIMLRIALIQNISNITESIVFMQKERNRAEAVAENIISSGSNINVEIERLKRKRINFTSPFAERFIKVLRDNFIENTEVYDWIDEELDKEDSSASRIVNINHQKQAIYQVSMENSVNGIREVSALKWKENFERLSYVEQVLKEDPAGIYKEMDFTSRDYYRHKIEKLSQKIKVPESFIARKAVECAKEASGEIYENHVGYYLLDKGMDCLKKKIKSSGEEYAKVDSGIENNITTGFYIGTIIFGTIFLDLIINGMNLYTQNLSVWKYIVGVIVLLIPSSEIFISIFNWSINKLVEPKFIPKMEFKQGIPEEFSTVVVIPALINNPHRVKSLISDMEVYYLANEEENLYFALLGDFKDSFCEEESDDKLIIEAALDEVKKLNQKYSKDGKDKFYFLNRYRKYNEKEEKWIGWERKRGKLMEFNSLIRGDINTSYNVIGGDITNLYNVKYVITLDADTKLPKDTAKLLIGAMSHPLNLPYLDKENKKVIRGHGLMQPRVSVSVLSANKTLYSNIFSGETGIDIYTSAISDVYEDLFDEGIFTGKGIYDVDVFNRILQDEIPENTVLSHDLLEGSYVRAGLVTDIELIDGYPAYYNSSCKRLHRWVRGDWQLIPWIFKKNSLNELSKWKIIDNLRRSVVSPAVIVLIIVALTLFSDPDNLLLIALISLLCPIFFDVSETVVSPVKGISLSGKVSNFKIAIEQFFLILSFLPYQAYLMLDAIIRTLYRVFISKKNLLQWQTAADVEAVSKKEFSNYLSSMWVGSAIGIIVALLGFMNSVERALLILPFCIIWFFSPWVAFNISMERKSNKSEEIGKDEKKLLRKLSRETWAYFEDFIAPETNWLSPDNYQEKPYKGIAYRTSPTNMAMGITSNIVAYDLGYIGISELQYRLDNIILNMQSLEKYKGHFYNWYDIKNKTPLYPRYISTVDSGNLVGYIWLVEETLDEYMKYPLINRNLTLGLKDTLELAEEEIYKRLEIKDAYKNFIEEFSGDYLDNYGLEGKNNIFLLKPLLHDLIKISTEFNQKSVELYWNMKVNNMAVKILSELDKFFPWIDFVDKNSQLEKSKYRFNKLANEVCLEKIPEVVDNIIKDFNDTENVKEFLLTTKSNAENLIFEIRTIRDILSNMGKEHNFSMLYSKKRQLFAIGYDVEKDTLGKNYYDLLASEARQASFVAIAKGEVEQAHWFNLGRSMTSVGGGKGLVSWSGTMFEYLMPLIIMKKFPDTLFSETYKYIVEVQKTYGDKNQIPWGISESAYYDFDVNHIYQYKAFGVPGIGLKRGLTNELVVSPYASVMALQVDFNSALNNIKKLMEIKAEGRYGFYDAIDYTSERLPKGNRSSIVRCFMIHHQGMSFMSLDNVLMKNILQERFHRIPRVKSVELLLQEKVPKAIVYDREEHSKEAKLLLKEENMVARKYTTAGTKTPETNIISNGSYSLMMTNSGSGYGKRKNTMVYRWREDATTDNTGMFFYIKNINSNEYWSATFEPCKHEGEEYEVIFLPDKSEFKRKDGNLRTYTEVTVSQEDEGEVRRISITNSSDYKREVEITSYFEVTLAPYNADLVHPAFGNLFIETEFIQEPTCVIASRRPKTKDEERLWLMQTIAVEGKQVGSVQYETSRVNFIGRNRNLINPRAMDNDAQLTKSVGAVIDPIVSMRIRLLIEPGKTSKVAYSTIVTDSREKAIELASKYRNMSNVNRIFQLSWTEVQLEMQYLGTRSNQVNMYQKIASKILFINNLFQDKYKYISKIKKGQSALWPYGISGDLPIVLVIIRDESHMELVRQLLLAHEYWSLKGLWVDLVLLNLQDTSYVQLLQDKIRDAVNSRRLSKKNASGGVFVYNRSTMNQKDIDFFIAVARIVIDAEKGELIKHLKDTEEEKIGSYGDVVINKKNSSNYSFKIPELQYFNDIGGFSKDGKSYFIILKNYSNTPAPWINVISNKKFGFHISENGVSYTWNKNSRENKLTTWSNDPVMDSEAEAIYIKDDVTEQTWSISPKPVRDSGEYLIEHGFGFSTFKHEANEILGEMTVFADIDDSVKISRVRLKNIGRGKRKLSLSYYAKLVLGVCHEQTSQYIYTGFNNKEQYIYARNPYSECFSKGICYMKILGGKNLSYTSSREEFIGRGGDVSAPKGLQSENFSGRVGAGVDPCFAENIKIELNENSETEILILLGQEDSFEEISRVIQKYNNIGSCTEELEKVQDYWEKLFNVIKVHTPDDAMNIMLNGWLMYQVITCRYWARTAFYQSGGAYGFRDQLQDVMAICYLEPDITRNHIIYSASRQYLEGDVQHWWHPFVESGIRTRFSDDLLWLPYVVAEYIQNTGDYSILEEEAPYLEDDQLKDGEDERYKISNVSKEKGTVYEHCIKAIEKSLKFGPHNIPLMGSGDWNDGMSTVGNKGQGESIWLGWFLYSILDKFQLICKFKEDNEQSDKYLKLKEFIRENIEKNGWDGSWYRRAYFDDGTPLGSVENEECQIDSISQSWAVISGAAKKSRAREAVDALERNLIREDKGLILLLTPAFDKSSLEPGYIKGYIPGVRENGGQYTHAAIWSVLALAKMCHNDRAYKAFSMINPINHTKTYLNCEIYKVEPYVMSADVYAIDSHVGRGGWSWYTGAAGWMYTTGIDTILGMKFKGEAGFTISPCIPDRWEEYSIKYTRDQCIYNIKVEKHSEKGVWLDGNKIDNKIVPFLEEGEHEVKVNI
ncbi:GH36-type glycosyl hydrolase domain-containing protein [Clostridium sp. WILCCON 0269]|uniref:GH36-type glycosyl hydrolase domain-containing protein n=1 Tax=Candidatus Clostridium eludens TaxID=3381663 RepID=A0ABW8SFY7_9CLOT